MVGLPECIREGSSVMHLFCLTFLMGQNFADKVSSCGVPDAQFPIKTPEQQNQRIWGGTEANPHSLPWQVVVRLHQDLPGGKIDTILCGGSIISPYWVVTAGHCVKDRYVFRIVAGMHTRGTADAAIIQIREKATIIQHPDFYKFYFGTVNDIALLKLKKPFEFNSYVQPVCINEQVASEKSNCLTSGWGQTEKASFSTVLKQGYMRIVNPSRCSTRYLNFDPQTMICAWEYDKSDATACHGDSGGPFVCKSETEESWFLIGVTSYGGSSCEKKLPMVFTKVSEYTNWIEKQMKMQQQSSLANIDMAIGKRSGPQSSSTSKARKARNTSIIAVAGVGVVLVLLVVVMAAVVMMRARSLSQTDQENVVTK